MKNFFIQNRLFVAILLLWILLFSGIRTLQHLSFGTNACDLSLFDYGMYYTLKGDIMADPFHKYGFGRWYDKEGELKFEPGKIKSWQSHFSIHFTPIIFFIVPFYLIFEGPLFLLYLQIFLVGLSAVPLYMIAKNVFDEKYIPIFIALIYLFFRHLLIGVMHDIHMEMLFPFFLFSAFYFIAVKKKPAFYFTFIFLVLLIKEDMAFYLFFFGLFIGFKLKEKLIGVVTSAVSFFYVVLVMQFIIPYFRGLEGMSGDYVYSHWGEGFGQIIVNIVTHPTKIFQGIDLNIFLKKFIDLIAPLLFVPFLSSFSLLIIPPVLAAVLSKIPQNYTFGIHYSVNLIPFLFMALIYGLAEAKKFLDRQKIPLIRNPFLVLMVVLLMVNLTNSNFWRIIEPSRYEAFKDYSMVIQAVNQVSPDASIAALSALIPHIPKRKNIYMLPEIDNAEYIIFHSGINLWPFRPQEFSKFVQRLENEKNYICVYRKGEFVIYKRSDKKI